MKKRAYFLLSLAVMTFYGIILNSCEGTGPEVEDPGTVTDIDGNVYKTVVIGDMVWMAENLKTTRYQNGDAIPELTEVADWINPTEGARCSYNNEAANGITYGFLYNYFAIEDTRNIAPEGWHVATFEEWSALVALAGGGTVAGGKLKEAGTSHWVDPNLGATDEKSFKALPGGYRYYDGSFKRKGLSGIWWSPPADGSDIMSWGMHYDEASMLGGKNASMELGFSVRCVKN